MFKIFFLIFMVLSILCDEVVTWHTHRFIELKYDGLEDYVATEQPSLFTASNDSFYLCTAIAVNSNQPEQVIKVIANNINPGLTDTATVMAFRPGENMNTDGYPSNGDKFSLNNCPPTDTIPNFFWFHVRGTEDHKLKIPKDAGFDVGNNTYTHFVLAMRINIGYMNANDITIQDIEMTNIALKLTNNIRPNNLGMFATGFLNDLPFFLYDGAPRSYSFRISTEVTNPATESEFCTYNFFGVPPIESWFSDYLGLDQVEIITIAARSGILHESSAAYLVRLDNISITGNTKIRLPRNTGPQNVFDEPTRQKFTGYIKPNESVYFKSTDGLIVECSYFNGDSDSSIQGHSPLTNTIINGTIYEPEREVCQYFMIVKYPRNSVFVDGVATVIITNPYNIYTRDKVPVIKHTELPAPLNCSTSLKRNIDDSNEKIMDLF